MTNEEQARALVFLCVGPFRHHFPNGGIQAQCEAGLEQNIQQALDEKDQHYLQLVEAALAWRKAEKADEAQRLSGMICVSLTDDALDRLRDLRVATGALAALKETTK